MKIIIILLDGLGDRAYKELDYRTPLQAAHTPNLDHLASIGSNGLFHASVSGECLPSEIAHYLLFGYDIKNFPGRGLLEAVGENVLFDDNDVLCLGHLTKIEWKNGVPLLTNGRDETLGTKEELSKLFNAISNYESMGIKFNLVQTRRNDAIIIMSNNASPFISDSDPITMGNPIAQVLPLDNNPEPENSRKTASALNNYLSHCHKRLSKKSNDANFLVTQRCGRRIKQETFEDLWGLKGMLIASGSVYIGLANEIGLDYKKVKDTEDPAQDLNDRLKTALNDNIHDFIHVHTKAPDEAAHKGTPGDKRDNITELDKGLSELIPCLKNNKDILVAVTGDHSTPSVSQLIHSGEPLPLIITGPNVRRDNVESFDEISAATGCLGFLRGKELLLMLMNYSDRSILLSHQLGNEKHPYYPKKYKTFNISKE